MTSHKKPHKHGHCKHEGTLNYCECCGVVYCSACEKEWPEKQIVTVEKVVYKEHDLRRWWISGPTSVGTSEQAKLIDAVSDKHVWDKDRFNEANQYITVVSGSSAGEIADILEQRSQRCNHQ